MGVIRNVSNAIDPDGPCIEDVFEDLIEETVRYPLVQTRRRRPRKIKHRSVELHAVSSVNVSSTKSGKKKKRIDNLNFLLSLVNPEDSLEMSIHDFIPYTISPFCQLLKEGENMEIWNEFINCSDNNEWFCSLSPDQNHLSELELEKASCQTETDEDDRIKHPAFSAIECFQKINNRLRKMLRKKHVPLGILFHLEKDIVTFFINRPQSVYQSQYPSSYERLLVHVLSQYMGLLSSSYNRNGSRWTRIRNAHPNFQPPTVLLSSFLERKMQKNVYKY